MASVPVAEAATSLGDYSDQFSFINYNNSQGSLDWTGESWVESNDDGCAVDRIASRSGTESNCPGDPLSGCGKEARLGIHHAAADLSAATSATLEYEYQRHTSWSRWRRAGLVRLEVPEAAGSLWRRRTLMHPTRLRGRATRPHRRASPPDTTIRFDLARSDDSHINFDYLTIELFVKTTSLRCLTRSPTHPFPKSVLFSFTATATDPNGGDASDFRLDGSEPAGASITAAGSFSPGHPTEAQGPGVYSFDVIVEDDGSPQMAG